MHLKNCVQLFSAVMICLNILGITQSFFVHLITAHNIRSACKFSTHDTFHSAVISVKKFSHSKYKAVFQIHMNIRLLATWQHVSSQHKRMQCYKTLKIWKILASKKDLVKFRCKTCKTLPHFSIYSPSGTLLSEKENQWQGRGKIRMWDLLTCQKKMIHASAHFREMQFPKTAGPDKNLNLAR